MTSRALKPSSFSLRPRRPSIARTASNSSTKSQDCPSPLSTSCATASTSEPATITVGLGSPVPPETQRIGRSRPIAIEQPHRRRSSQYTPTPPEALSARGDRPGGYFPFHEDLHRSHLSHPFNHHRRSRSASSTSSTRMPEAPSPNFTPNGHAIVETRPIVIGFQQTPVPDSFAMSAPLGKYHPSNWKKGTVIPETLLAAHQPQHTRQKSEIKKKIHQYQRGMVEQAAAAAHMSIPGSKPISPRLLPLLSPGPVTPMELEERDGYLVAGAPSGDHISDKQKMIEAMLKAEMEKDKAARK